MTTIKIHLKSVAFWTLRFVQLQLFLTIVSLPILIAWGLPLSILSPLGNLIFSPALTLFLLLSSAIFFGELLNIPTTWLVHALEKVTDWWLVIMHSDSQTWLVGFIKPSPWFMVVVPMLAFWILLNRTTRHMYVTTGLLSALFLVIIMYLKCISAPKQAIMTIPCNKGEVTLVRTHNSTILIDPGVIGQRISAVSWAQYTLMPSIIAMTGSTTIDHLILMQPTNMLFQAIERLCTKMNIKNIYLVYWEGQAPRAYLHNFFALKNTAADKNIGFHRIGNYPLTITLGATSDTVRIEPVNCTIKNTTFSFPALSANLYIDNQEITIYSAKYAKKIKSTPGKKTQLKPNNNVRVEDGDQ